MLWRDSLILLLVLLKRSLGTSEVDKLVSLRLSPLSVSVLSYMVKLYQTCDPGELCLPQCFIHLLTGQLFQSDIVYDEQRLFQMINDLPTIFEVVRTMMSMVALVALAETTSVQMSFGFAATSVRNGSMEDV
ncbi:BnaC02g34550D [Brassica napus]|uniref:(rape) hypothetical protein n=1 Tax=Brassica napus TaxID=3708 RepID=A0A078FRR0_BRANA|nr:unnamed protein product [Brassica napus]CDY15836.1 BnaC02g34550D [Brassica napus]